MKESKRKKLEAAGWKVGSPSEFLGLSPAEEMLVNIKMALAKKVIELRQLNNITQNKLAAMIGSSQSRIAKVEIADRSVSMELLVKSLVALGETQVQIGKIVGTKVATRKKASRKKQPVKT